MTKLEILIDTHARCPDAACRVIIGQWIIEEMEREKQEALTSVAVISPASLAFASGIRTYIGSLRSNGSPLGIQ